MNKESSKEAKKMFNDLNIMIVINLDPVTPVILEDLYSELMGGQIPHWEFGFSSLLDLLAAWFFLLSFFSFYIVQYRRVQYSTV